MSPNDKPLVWFHGEVHSPPFSNDARIEAGYLLRLLQKGEIIFATFATDAINRKKLP
jgi:hypothetical protein